MLFKYLHPLSTIHTYDMYVTLFIIEDASAIIGLNSYCDKKIVSFVMTFCIEFQSKLFCIVCNYIIDYIKHSVFDIISRTLHSKCSIKGAKTFSSQILTR